MKSEWDIEYPCGLKTKGKMESGFFDFFVIEINNNKPCPIHGLRCSKKI